MTRFSDGASFVVLTNAAPDAVADDPRTEAVDERPADAYRTILSVMVSTWDWDY